MAAIENEQSALHGRGRVLGRVSGTEPLIRVMAEAPTQDETDAVCERLRAVVAARSAPSSSRLRPGADRAVNIICALL